MKSSIRWMVALLAVMCVNLAPAVDNASDIPQVARDPDMEAGRAAVERKNWKLAVEQFGRAAAKDARNADARNMLGYAHRHLGNIDLALKHYNDALKIDPNHRGVHEYIGEAYLMRGDLAKAEEHLKILNKLCTFSCEELRDLRRSVEEYKRKKK